MPHVDYADAASALAWLTKVFGLTKEFVVQGPNHTVRYAESSWGNGVVMVGTRRTQEATPIIVSLVVGSLPALERHYQTARAVGARVVEPQDSGTHGWSYVALDLEENLLVLRDLPTHCALGLPQGLSAALLS